MAANDWAIVIGIARYPEFGGNAGAAPRDLDGPVNDAETFMDWLTNPSGGDVPAGQVIKVTSDDFAAPDVGPDLDDLKAKLNQFKNDIDQAAVPLGRLYIYASGHGYGRERLRGGVYLADSKIDKPTDLFISKYLSWFSERNTFRECVLFCDACMDQGRLAFPTPVHWLREIPLGPNTTRSFASYAARFAGQAVEGPMENGTVHGVYSYALKLGLDGAAAVADGNGGRHITTRSLQDYLIAAMPKLMTDAQVSAPAVSKEPDQGPLDDFILVANPPLFAKDVTIKLPVAAGNSVLLEDASFANLGTHAVAGSAVTVNLSPGLYLLRADGGGWEEGFEYTGAERELDLQ
ncbi:MAG: caspase family protein [Pseudomonadota bacterium]